MRGKLIVFVVLLGFVLGACAATQPPPGRVGELRGRIAQVERERIAVETESDGQEWFQIKPFTTVRGGDLSSGKRVYVRYLRELGTDPPRALSITVYDYTLSPSTRGPGSFKVPNIGF
ncbi:MAG: hypothetical protein ACE5G5_12375 [Candidatus Methylomirabilales bacterium]